MRIAALVLVGSSAVIGLAQDADLTPRRVHLVPRPSDRDDTWRLQVRWITDTPCVGRAACGSTEACDAASAAEAVPCNNHRIDIAGLPADQPQWVRITNEADGQEASGEPVKVEPPRIPAGVRQPRTVALTVANPSATPLSACPITAGLPFRQGELGRVDTVRIVANGEALVPQTRVLCRWPDNSIKWLLLDWQMDVPAEGPVTTQLEYGRNTRSATAHLSDLVAMDPNRITVDTGPLRLGLTGEGIDAPPGFVLSRLTTIDGKQLLGKPDSVQLEENGPWRAVVRVDGHQIGEDGTRLFGYTLRLFFFRGKSTMRIDHVFANDHLDDQMVSIRALDLVFPGSLTAALVGTEEGEVSLTEGQRLFQEGDDRYTAASANGRRATGWVQAEGGPAIAVRDFWQQWPKSLGLEDGGLVVGLCPAIEPQDLYANHEEEHRLWYYVRDGSYTFRRGLEKRHELWVDLQGAMAPEMRVLAAERIVATAPPRWYADSDALADILPQNDEAFSLYDEAAERNLGLYVEARDARHEYGLMNFGDWYGERRHNWGNIEYDTQHCFLIQYLRSGLPGFLVEGERSARHNMDIDVVHHATGSATPPEWSGGRLPGQVWVHCMGHTGGYYPKEYLDMGVYAQGYSTNRGHMWTQGNWEYYLLTGDERARECARLVSDWAAGPQTTNFRFTNQREPGWMTILVTSAYQATGDPYYLNAARLMIDKLFAERDASPKPESGLRYRELLPGHCYCEEHHWGAAGFMAGVLMTGLKMYYQATGDEEVAEDIVRIARFCVDTMYDEESGLFHYTSCPKSSQSASYGFIMGNGIAFAANYANDERLRQVMRDYLVRTMASFQGAGSNGKTIAFYMCAAPYAMSEFATFPGPRFDEYMERETRRLNAPGARRLPTLVPNPDYEIDVRGWNRRGGQLSLDDSDPHSGRHCAKLAGHFEGVNEYLVTEYGTPGPWELSWLEPGRECRLSAWLKVESISKGAPAPDIRISFREDNQTRGHAYSDTQYDLGRIGEWQKLQGTFTVPDYTTQAYLAINTHTKDPVDIVLCVDDWRLVPVEAPENLVPQHLLLRIDSPDAGRASVKAKVSEKGRLHFWLQAATVGGEPATVKVTCDGTEAGECRPDEDVWQWVEVGAGLDLDEGEHEFVVTWPGGRAQVRALCVTDEVVE